jgi:rRNA small subunit pseudouridine methyltransferase Nep1
MLTLILGEAELELVPSELLEAPSVKARSRHRRRKPAHLLLDQAADHVAMSKLDEGDRRGRPDIVHLVALLLHDSPLAHAGRARMLVHTRHDELVRMRPGLRPPRAQATFYKLCEDLLRQGRVPLDKPLLTMERARPLADILASEARGLVVLLSEDGEPSRTRDFEQLAREHTDVTLVLGGFPKGTWRRRPEAARMMRVAQEQITAASALVPALAGFEDALLRPEG